jgi:hypothetical protein
LAASRKLEEAVSDGSSADVITGVSRSGVDSAYIERIRDAVEENMAKMADLIDEQTYYITGFESKGNVWKWCQLTNASVPGGVQWSCPTTLTDPKGNHTHAPDQVLIALYNPSLVTHRVVSVPIFDALYDVSVYQPGGSLHFREDFSRATNARVLCDYFNPHNESSCVLFVNYTVPGQHLGYLVLKRNTSAQGMLVSYQMKGSPKIETPH